MKRVLWLLAALVVLPGAARAFVDYVTIAPIPSTALEASHVLKSSPGAFYGASVTTGATAGFFMLFDATSAPADGAVTPVKCKVAPASSTTDMSTDAGGPVWQMRVGITLVFSSGASCLTKTGSATAFFSGQAQ